MAMTYNLADNFAISLLKKVPTCSRDLPREVTYDVSIFISTEEVEEEDLDPFSEDEDDLVSYGWASTVWRVGLFSRKLCFLEIMPYLTMHSTNAQKGGRVISWHYGIYVPRVLTICAICKSRSTVCKLSI